MSESGCSNLAVGVLLNWQLTELCNCMEAGVGAEPYVQHPETNFLDWDFTCSASATIIAPIEQKEAQNLSPVSCIDANASVIIPSCLGTSKFKALSARIITIRTARQA